MLDRFGSPIIVAFSPKEILWIEAAMTLEPHARREAYRDITELTGRSYCSIWHKAREIVDERKAKARLERLTAASKRYLAIHANDG